MEAQGQALPGTRHTSPPLRQQFAHNLAESRASGIRINKQSRLLDDSGAKNQLDADKLGKQRPLCSRLASLTRDFRKSHKTPRPTEHPTSYRTARHVNQLITAY